MHLDNSNVSLYRTMSVVVVDNIIIDDAPVVEVATCLSAVGGWTDFCGDRPLGGTWRAVPQTYYDIVNLID
jgi:hypothetical protein